MHACTRVRGRAHAALHAFIDFLSWCAGPQARRRSHRTVRAGGVRIERRAQTPGLSRPGHYTLPQCPDGGYQPIIMCHHVLSGDEGDAFWEDTVWGV